MLHHGGCRVPSAVRRASPGTQGPAAASPGPSGTRDPSLRPRAEEQAPPHPGRPTHASTRRIPVRRPPSARLPQQAQTRCLSPNARLGHEAKTRSSGRGTSRFQRNGSEHRQPPGAPLREGAGHLHGTARPGRYSHIHAPLGHRPAAGSLPEGSAAPGRRVGRGGGAGSPRIAPPAAGRTHLAAAAARSPAAGRGRAAAAPREREEKEAGGTGSATRRGPAQLPGRRGSEG